MNKQRTIEGRWWIPGTEHQGVFGVLTFDPNDGLILSIKIARSRNDSLFLKSVVNRPSIPSVLKGSDANGDPVSLFGCSGDQWSVRPAMDCYRIRAKVAILNDRSPSWDEATSRHAAATFTHLDAWMNRKVVEMHKPGQSGLSFTVQMFDPLEFSVAEDCKMRIEASNSMAFHVNDARIQLVHRVYFTFARALPLRSIYDDYIHAFVRLLTLLTGEQVFVQELVLLNADPFQTTPADLQRSEVLFSQHGAGDDTRVVSGLQMITNYGEIAPRLHEVLKRWFSLNETLRPVLDLYFAVVSNWVLTDETRFLLLAQAWEVYHSRSGRFSSSEIAHDEHQQRVREIVDAAPPAYRAWVGEKLQFANQKTLAKRIDDLLNACPDEATRLTEQVPDLASTVRHTRNYLTHYGEQSRAKAAAGLQLRRLAFLLLDLLEIFLMTELGIAGKPVERILERNLSRVYKSGS